MTASTAIPPIGPQHAKINLMGLSRLQMEQFFLELGEKKFRAHQILKWIHHAGITQIEEMSNLGKALREKLMEVAEVRPPEIVSQQDSSDGTR
jgi:23S rRNA (adenine2503-C2)-methyltransferase